MKEAPVASNLLMVQFRYEPHVRARAGVGPPHSSFVAALDVIQVLPGWEVSAHWRSDEKDRALLPLHLADLLTCVSYVKQIQWLTVFGVNNSKVKRKSEGEVAVSSSLDLLRHPGRRVDLRYQMSVASRELSPVGLAGLAQLREEDGRD